MREPRRVGTDWRTYPEVLHGPAVLRLRGADVALVADVSRVEGGPVLGGHVCAELSRTAPGRRRRLAHLQAVLVRAGAEHGGTAVT